MIDFLLAPPNIWIVIGAIVVLAILWFIQLFFDNVSNFVFFIRMAITLIAINLLWYGGAWLVAQFMDTVHSHQ